MRRLVTNGGTFLPCNLEKVTETRREIGAASTLGQQLFTVNIISKQLFWSNH